MSRFLVVILVLAALLFPLTAAAGTVPNAADSIAEQLDEQLMMRYAGDDPGMTKKTASGSGPRPDHDPGHHAGRYQ